MTSEDLAWRIRYHAIKMVHVAHASHIGSILSAADLVAVLYNDVAYIDPCNPTLQERDRVILSKGHSGVVIYSTLAELGFFDASLLETYGQDGTVLSCHISHKGVPGVDLSTGSLGQGISVACGMALNGKVRNINYHTYVIVGDGECNEGSVWETAMFAAQHRLDNLTVIVDRNNIQAMGTTHEVLELEPFSDKWSAFGWHVVEVSNGHNHNALKEAFKNRAENKPRVIIAHTIKGKGISFMENSLLWHYRDPQGKFYENALAELEASKP